MLKGIKVVEMATYVAAPGAAGVMADWGADVVKIEPPGGDPIRKFFETFAGRNAVSGNPIFELDNRGKRSISIDPGTPEGAEVVRKLIDEADVFLTNVRPKSLERSGLDWTALRARNPRLIYASVTGYGLQGPERDRPGFDLAVFWARAGMGRLTTPKGQEPMPMRTAVGDHTTSLATLSGILAALFERERTGEGKLVETSLLRTGIFALGSDMAIQLFLGRVGSTQPRAQAISPLNNFYQTADGNWIVLLTRHAGSQDWIRLIRAIGRPEFETDSRFATPAGRRENGPDLIAAFDEAFRKRTLAEWAEILDDADVVWAPVQTPAQVAADPQAEAAGAFVEIEAKDGNRFRSVAPPVRFDGTQETVYPSAPKPGEHTEEVLRSLGYGEAEIADLRARKAVA